MKRWAAAAKRRKQADADRCPSFVDESCDFSSFQDGAAWTVDIKAKYAI
jgi:hypothetical protein